MDCAITAEIIASVLYLEERAGAALEIGYPGLTGNLNTGYKPDKRFLPVISDYQRYSRQLFKRFTFTRRHTSCNDDLGLRVLAMAAVYIIKSVLVGPMGHGTCVYHIQIGSLVLPGFRIPRFGETFSEFLGLVLIYLAAQSDEFDSFHK
jgi:hypothetical protein